MSSEMLQDAVVTAVALAALALLARRVFGFAGLGAGRSRCAECPSARGACESPAQTIGSAPAQHPAVLIRSSHGVRPGPPA
jgi:hypothetical protein